MTNVRLYSYFRSSAAFRVRIALNLKRMLYQMEFIHLARGAQFQEAFAALNPQGLVPVLEDNGVFLSQSLALVEYLEETQPDPPLLPADVLGRVRVRGLAHLIASDIHPLNNLRVLKYLSGPLGLTEEQRLQWYRHWVASGLAALETRLASEPQTGIYCHGSTAGLADLCLVPQIFNAKRFACDLTAYPIVMRIFESCMQLEAFDRAAPYNQPDFES